MPSFVGGLDQGTTSTRFLVFDDAGHEVARHQVEHRQHLPRAGWVEHDPMEIWERVVEVIAGALARAGLGAGDLAAIGIANQRETTVVWDRHSGLPVANAIVWQDTRTAPEVASLAGEATAEAIAERTGLVPATYFSATKLGWILEHVEGVRPAAERGDVLFGTVDSWLVWKLTGGAHVTDVTNASRTMLMDLAALAWDPELLARFEVPAAMLPAIGPSTIRDSALVTATAGPLGRQVPIGAILGDQQAAMLGQVCLEPGDAKSTYGTGSFLLLNTGEGIVRSRRGLLGTVCYQFEGEAPRYALEGSVAVTGSAIQWLRDQLGVIGSAAESERLAAEVDDTEDLYFVPAFSGLFAPRWRPDARGVIVGLTRAHTRAHLARAALEAICYQTLEVLEAMVAEAGASIPELRVDGGVSTNDLCMQLQADVLGVPVVRPAQPETTALGAALAAGAAVGLYEGGDALRRCWRADRRFEPRWSEDRRRSGYARWRQAVERALDWAGSGAPAEP